VKSIKTLSKHAKLIRFSVFGIVLQGASLLLFVLVSRTNVAAIGKPSVISLAALSVGILLWCGVRNAPDWISLFLLPLTLAVGYIIAFHLLGVIGFPGLLNDLHSPYGEYFSSVFRVIVVLYLLYGIATILLFTVNRAWHRSRNLESK
jgi:hypothetical protein